MIDIYFSDLSEAKQKELILIYGDRIKGDWTKFPIASIDVPYDREIISDDMLSPDDFKYSDEYGDPFDDTLHNRLRDPMTDNDAQMLKAADKAIDNKFNSRKARAYKGNFNNNNHGGGQNNR